MNRLLYLNSAAVVVVIAASVGVVAGLKYVYGKPPITKPAPLSVGQDFSQNSPVSRMANTADTVLVGTWKQTNNSDKAAGYEWMLQFNLDGTFAEKQNDKVMINNRGRQGATTTGLWSIVPDISKELVYDTGIFQKIHPPKLPGIVLKWDDFTASDYYIIAISEDGNRLSRRPWYLKNGSWKHSSVEFIYERVPPLPTRKKL